MIPEHSAERNNELTEDLALGIVRCCTRQRSQDELLGVQPRPRPQVPTQPQPGSDG